MNLTNTTFARNAASRSILGNAPSLPREIAWALDSFHQKMALRGEMDKLWDRFTPVKGIYYRILRRHQKLKGINNEKLNFV